MNETFSLFGNLWLESLYLHLPNNDMKELELLLPMIKTFKKSKTQGKNKFSRTFCPSSGDDLQSYWYVDIGYTPSQPDWEIKKSFKCSNLWKLIGGRRSTMSDWPPEYLVEPSGLLNSPVACHLYNPTFSVDDVQNRSTEDLSSQTISQIHKAGFSTQNNCFIFDHIARRDLSQHCSQLYPEELVELYESFSFELRRHMGVVVEVCWGCEGGIGTKKIVEACWSGGRQSFWFLD